METGLKRRYYRTLSALAPASSGHLAQAGTPRTRAYYENDKAINIEALTGKLTEARLMKLTDPMFIELRDAIKEHADLKDPHRQALEAAAQGIAWARELAAQHFP
jgi:hypothetical protein